MADSGGSVDQASGDGSSGGGGSSSGSTASSGSSGGAGNPSDGAVVGGFTISGTITDSTSGNPLPGASMCLLTSPSTCTTADANGNFTLGGLASASSGFTGSLASYVTGIWPVTPTGNITGWTILLRTTTRVAALAQQVGTTFGSNTGAIVFDAFDGNGNNLSGVSVSSTSGSEISYFAGNGSGLDPTLGATTANGGGYIFEVSPATVGVTFASPGRTCTPNGSEGWPGTGGATMTVPVQAGRLTRAASVCQ